MDEKQIDTRPRDSAQNIVSSLSLRTRYVLFRSHPLSLPPFVAAGLHVLTIWGSRSSKSDPSRSRVELGKVGDGGASLGPWRSAEQPITAL